MGRLFQIRNVSFAFLVALAWSAVPAAAQEWPTRFITLIVPFGPGSASDIVARILAPAYSEVLGQQVVVENIGGAGGNIGTTRAAKAAPDGYTMVLGAVDTFAQSPSLFKNPPYNPVTDFTPVGLAVEQPLVLTVRKDLPVNNLKEFAAYLKANQAKMQFASAGVGSAVHLACSQITVRRRRHGHACPVSQLGPGAAGPDCRTHRLLLSAGGGRDPADPEQIAEGACHPDPGALAAAAGSAHRQGAGI